MPEGDTILKTARVLERALSGKTLTAVRFPFGLPGEAKLCGRRVTAVEARGKNLLIHFDDGRCLYTHLRMRGSWHIYRPGEAWHRSERSARAVLETQEEVAVCFSAPVVELLTERQTRRHPTLTRLGPDLLSPGFDCEEAVSRLRRRADQPVGEALLVQSAVAGIGNVYKSEILFLCGADPFAPVCAYSDQELRRLLEVARQQMRRNLDATPRRIRGLARGSCWVYERSGQPCRRCGESVRMRRQGLAGRSTYWCPSCQPARVFSPPSRALGKIPLALLFVAGLAALASSCRRTPLFARAPVVIISVDTLRADHLPAYGYRFVETPAFDALARDSVVFDNALSHAPLTLPSHASLFTGLLPFANGVRDNIGYRLGKEHVTLASFLKARGYATGAAVSAVVLARSTGISEGFDFYDDAIESGDVSVPLGLVQRSGQQTEKLLEEWIAKLGSAPFVAFLHVYEPHAPYDPPEPFRSRYASRPYDGEIACADAVVGQLIGFLKRRALYDRSILLFLSDHGEGLGDHGEEEHGILLYREELRIPLFVKLPGSREAGRRVGEPVGLMDVFPTVAALLGQAVPKNLPGRPLFISGGRTDPPRRMYSETLYPRLHFGWSDLASLTDERYQYIQAPRAELYDWRADPAERNDLARDLSPRLRSLSAELSRMDRPIQSPGVSDPEAVKKLASLGYISAVAPIENRKDLPDPKDRIATIDRLKEVSRLLDEHRDDQAVRLLETLARENPRMLDVWETLARILRRAGRAREALAALEKADRLSPGTAPILLVLADLHRQLGEHDRARQLALAARTAGATQVEEELASIELTRGDLAAARRETEAALAARPFARSPLLLSAQLALQTGDLSRALSFCDRAVELGRARQEGPLINLQATRGDILARLNRTREAQDAFRAEIRDFPENLDAWSRLALLLYSSSEESGEFAQLLEEMTRRIPTRRSFESAARVCEIVGERSAAVQWRRRAEKRSPS